MKKIINPLDKKTLMSELKKIRFVRNTTRGGNEIYRFKCNESEALMDEVGRLREITFRESGGGTGKEKDIDNYDISDAPFGQLILWDPDGEAIIGGYRFLMGCDIKNDENGIPLSPTSGLFSFSKLFLEKYWPYTMELGRSFVQPLYQPSVNRKKGIYALDNLWDGLGSLVIDFPKMKYFFGKMTMYPSFDRKSRDLILYFLNKYFPDKDNLLTPNFPIKPDTDVYEMEQTLTQTNYKEDYKILNSIVRNRNEYIPPLFTAYMNLSETMKSFRTSVNTHFGDVEETGIMITVKDIFPDKIKRYLESYKPIK